MDKIDFDIESVDFDTLHLDLIKSACDKVGVEARCHKPYWYKLHKIGYTSMDIMTISLTYLCDGKWVRNSTIEEVYEQIKNHFK
jgi:hypothetical protein